ncbi:hypothetical protein D3C78_1748880 [compost metagenome]
MLLYKCVYMLLHGMGAAVLRGVNEGDRTLRGLVDQRTQHADHRCQADSAAYKHDRSFIRLIQSEISGRCG